MHCHSLWHALYLFDVDVLDGLQQGRLVDGLGAADAQAAAGAVAWK